MLLNDLTDDIIHVGDKLKVKETKKVNEKKKAPGKQTTVQVANAITHEEMLALLNTLPGKWIDNDNFPYGARFQCMDVAVWWALQLSKGKFKMWGNARDAILNKLPEGWQLIKNEPDTLPKIGDIAVFTKGIYDNKYGHIGIVYKNPTLTSFIIAEQNFNGLGNTPVMTRLDYYNGVSHFIRPKTL